MGAARGPLRRGHSDVARERRPTGSRPRLQYTREQLQELAFGAYVGLVREQGGSTGRLRHRVAGGPRSPNGAEPPSSNGHRPAGHQAAVIPVFVQALGDPNQAVRLQAFDQLAALDDGRRHAGAAALGAGHTDIGVRGLEKLAGGGTSAEGQAVLEEALRTRTDDLAIEAAKLLAARRGLVAVAGLALGQPMNRYAGRPSIGSPPSTTKLPPPVTCCGRRCSRAIPRS